MESYSSQAEETPINRVIKTIQEAGSLTPEQRAHSWEDKYRGLVTEFFKGELTKEDITKVLNAASDNYLFDEVSEVILDIVDPDKDGVMEFSDGSQVRLSTRKIPSDEIHGYYLPQEIQTTAEEERDGKPSTRVMIFGVADALMRVVR